MAAERLALARRLAFVPFRAVTATSERSCRVVSRAPWHVAPVPVARSAVVRHRHRPKPLPLRRVRHRLSAGCGPAAAVAASGRTWPAALFRQSEPADPRHLTVL